MESQTDRVWMIGWEYPPHNSGGLGVACQGLTKSLAQANTEIFFSLPFALGQSVPHMKVVVCTDPKALSAGRYPPFAAYNPSEMSPEAAKKRAAFAGMPGSFLEAQVEEYARSVQREATKHQAEFEVVHAHDWMAFAAGMRVKQELQKPLIVHVHSTEYDRIPSGQGASYITQVESAGLNAADKVVAVSYYTKNILVREYGIDPDKIEVIHNGVNPPEWEVNPGTFHFSSKRPVILFMGRLTGQKGPEYFLTLAKNVLRELPDALFIVAGNGDLYQSLLLTTAHEKLSASVLFTGFARGIAQATLLNRADLFIMPSVSEPFGLAALEAAQHHTPVIISKNAGVTEVLPSALAIDFWDMNKMTESIVNILKDPNRRQRMTDRQLSDVQKVTWTSAAQKVKNLYRQVLSGEG